MKGKSYKRPVLKQRKRHMFRQFFNGWPWIIWLAAAIAVLALLPGGMYRVRFNGVAERIYEYVSPIQDGRLKSLTVGMGDIVGAGQLIGELDNEALAAKLLMDQASLMKTRDKVHSIRYEIESMKLEEAKMAAELSALEAQWSRTEDLLKKHLVLEQDVEDLRPQIESTKKILSHYPHLIEQLTQRLEAANLDMEKFDTNQLNELVAAQCRLVATTSGVVAEVLHQPGDIIETGDPVVRISNISTRRIIAFMPEAKRMDMAVGERCRIITEANRDVFHGEVKSITTDIRKLPVNTGFNDMLLRGRRIVIDINDGDLLPGEQVVVVPDISILDQWFDKK